MRKTQKKAPAVDARASEKELLADILVALQKKYLRPATMLNVKTVVIYFKVA